MKNSPQTNLSEELKTGEAAARALAVHLAGMGASSARLAVKLGREKYVVIVAKEGAPIIPPNLKMTPYGPKKKKSGRRRVAARASRDGN